MIREYLSKVKRKFLKKNYYCSMCKAHIPYWNNFGSDAAIYNKVHIVGGGIRACQCPECGSIDRGRWIDYILSQYTDAYTNKEAHILHIAPEIGIPDRIKKTGNHNYITGDLAMEGVDVFMDVTDIPFKNDWFDIVIMNHVISYIEDEEKAIGELLRVMKDTGILIISFPICMEYESTVEKNGLDNDASFEEFGTEGNCRMYGADYIKRMEKYGIEIKTYSPCEVLDEETIRVNGFLKDDIVLLCTKKVK